MKAIVYKNYGAPNVLKLQEMAKPTPKEKEILVKVHATTVTVADVKVRSFDIPPSIWLPARLTLGLTKPKNQILGAELAGEVEAIGKDVTRFKPGDQIYAATLPHFGGYAEYHCLHEDTAVSHKPKNLSYEEAAALPIGARTALYYLRKANIKKGQKILIYGASGSVGTYAVQLAKYFGAEVTGVCSTKNLELVKSLGADHVIDYTKEEFSATSKTYDIVFEAVNKSSFSACMKILKSDGVYLNITNPLPTFSMLKTKLMSKKRLVLGQNVPDEPEYLTYLTKLVEAGKLKPIIDRRYPLENIREAHRYTDTGRKRGNVVISVA